MSNIQINGVVLECDYRFIQLTKKEKEEICNGCGTAGWKGSFVPETMWGLKITDACQIHDFDYYIGQTKDQKEVADDRFLRNLYSIISAKTKWSWVKVLRRIRARTYFKSVSKLGDDAFFDGKTTK